LKTKKKDKKVCLIASENERSNKTKPRVVTMLQSDCRNLKIYFAIRFHIIRSLILFSHSSTRSFINSNAN